MKTLVTVAVVVVVVLVCILGVSGFATKVSAGREVAFQQIHKATSDDVILQEIGIELRKAAERNAEAQVELEVLRHEDECLTDQAGSLESDLTEHRQALTKEQALLETDQQEFNLNGQRVTRQRVEQDILARLRFCKSLESDLRDSQEESTAYQQSLIQFQTQLSKATQEYQTKLTEYDRLRAELRTARVIQGLSTRSNSLLNLGENSNLIRMMTEVRKRIARSRASSELFSPTTGSGLLDLSSDSGTSAKEAVDTYLESVAQSNVVQSRPEIPVQSSRLLEVTD